MFSGAKRATIRQGKAVGGDPADDTANKALQHDALSKLGAQAGADNQAVDALGDPSEDLVKNPPAVPTNTAERDKENREREKQAKKQKKRTFNVAASSGPYGACEPIGTVAVVEGEPQTFDFIPDEGCKLANVVVDNFPLGPVQSYSFSKVAAPHSIYPIFEPETKKPEPAPAPAPKVAPKPKAAPPPPKPKPAPRPAPQAAPAPVYVDAPARHSSRHHHRHKMVHAHKHAPVEHIHRHYHYHQDQRILNLSAGGDSAPALAAAPEDEPPRPRPSAQPALPPREQRVAPERISGVLQKLSDRSGRELRLKSRHFALRPEEAVLGFGSADAGAPSRYFVDLCRIASVREGWTGAAGSPPPGSAVDAAEIRECGFELEYGAHAPMRLLARSSSEASDWLAALRWVLSQSWPPVAEDWEPEPEREPRGSIEVFAASGSELRRLYPEDERSGNAQRSSRRESRGQSRGSTRSRRRSRSRSRSRSRGRSSRADEGGSGPGAGRKARGTHWWEHTQGGIQQSFGG